METIKEKVALTNGTNWGLLELTGKDRLQFLHNQTTNDIAKLTPGSGCDTVFVNSTGRTLDLATVYNLGESIWILISSIRREFLWQWIDRYIFPADKVKIEDISQKYQVLKLIGSQSEQLLKEVLHQEIIETNYASHQEIESIRVAIGTGLDLPGYTLFIPSQDYSFYWEKFKDLGAIPLSEADEEEYRIRQGRPKVNQELTEDYNALEAGLWRAISFTKGCYIGQETIARLNTYKGVKQRLWGLKLTHQVPLNTPIYQEENKIGIITSCCVTSSQEVLGLAYIKTKAGGEGLEVTVDQAKGKIIAPPYLSHDYYQPSK